MTQLPPNRQLKKIGEIAFIKSGKRLPKGFFVQDTKTNYPYIRVSDFGSDGTIDESNIKYISEEVYNQISKYIITDQDLYISIAGTIGKTGIISSSLNGSNLTENAVRLVYKDLEEVDNQYVLYFTKSGWFAEQAGLATRTVAMPKLAINRLENISIPLPPLPVQHKIVAALDEASRQIEASKSALKNQIAALDQLWQSSLSEVFEKCENNFSFSDKNIIDIIDGDRGSNYPKKSEFTTSGYCLFLNTSNVRKGYWDLERLEFINKKRDELLRKGKTKPGDVIITTRGTIGNCAYISEDFEFKNIRINSGMVILRTNKDRILPQYLLKLLLSPVFASQVNEKTSGSAQPQLPINIMKSIALPLPDLATQQTIVTQLDELSQQISLLKSEYTAQLHHFDDLWASILDQAFRGELES